MTHNRLLLSLIFIIVGGLPLGAAAQCGGLCIYEVGTPDNAASAAGASARAEDATTAYWNPAGMTRLEETQWHFGVMGAYSNPKLDIDESKSVGDPSGSVDGGTGWGGFAPLAGSYFVHDTTDDLKLGITVGGTVGGSIDYGDNWIARQYLTKVDIGILSIRPAIAYQISEMVSVGALLGINYGFIDWELRGDPSPTAPTIELDNGDDWDVNGGLGVLIEPQEGTRIGVTYQSEIDLTLTGKVRSPMPTTGNFSAGFQTPQGINTGLFQTLTEETALLFDVGWSDWSSFDTQPITVDANHVNIPRNFKDTWRIGTGLQHRPTGSPWTLRSGISYDSNPVGASDRLPDTPISDTWRLSWGSDYEFDETWTAGWSYTLAYFPNIKYDNVVINPNSPVRITGEADDAFGHFLGMYVQRRFGEPS